MRIANRLPNFHFKVNGHPIGFIIESDSKDKAVKEFNLLSLDPLSGIHGFTYHDVEKVSVVPEKAYYLLNSMKIY
jgi:hypothetical protein